MAIVKVEQDAVHVSVDVEEIRDECFDLRFTFDHEGVSVEAFDKQHPGELKFAMNLDFSSYIEMMMRR